MIIKSLKYCENCKCDIETQSEENAFGKIALNRLTQSRVVTKHLICEKQTNKQKSVLTAKHNEAKYSKMRYGCHLK